MLSDPLGQNSKFKRLYPPRPSNLSVILTPNPPRALGVRRSRPESRQRVRGQGRHRRLRLRPLRPNVEGRSGGRTSRRDHEGIRHVPRGRETSPRKGYAVRISRGGSPVAWPGLMPHVSYPVPGFNLSKLPPHFGRAGVTPSWRPACGIRRGPPGTSARTGRRPAHGRGSPAHQRWRSSRRRSWTSSSEHKVSVRAPSWYPKRAGIR